MYAYRKKGDEIVHHLPDAEKQRIKVNPSNCTHVSFTLTRQDCPQIEIYNTNVPAENQFKYLGVHINWRLTWFRQIKAK